MTRIRRRRVVGVLGMPGIHDRALVGGRCIYNGYVQLELLNLHNYILFTCVDSAKTGCMVEGKVYVDI
jgi:hypothetical protein